MQCGKATWVIYAKFHHVIKRCFVWTKFNAYMNWCTLWERQTECNDNDNIAQSQFPILFSCVFMNGNKAKRFQIFIGCVFDRNSSKVPVFNVMCFHKFKLFHRYDYHFNKYGNWIVLNMIFPWPFHFTYYIDGNMSSTYDYITHWILLWAAVANGNKILKMKMTTKMRWRAKKMVLHWH